MESGYRLYAATGLHRGGRDYQQDQVELISHPRFNGCVLGIVADGMGGRTGGRKASDQVLLTARQLFDRYRPGVDDGAALLRQIGQEAHMVIRLTAISSEQEPHSTMAVFLINPGGECHWLHAGDSRLYQFRGARLLRRTRDHSLVENLVAQGEIDEQQADSHPQSHVLLSCLGTEREPNLESTHIPRLEIGDSLLVCSDGLWHYFTNDELGSIIDTMPPREACEFLIAKARQRAAEGGDNLALIVVRVAAAPAPAKKTRRTAHAPLK